MIEDMKLDTPDLISTLLETDDEILKEKATRILEVGEMAMDGKLSKYGPDDEYHQTILEQSLDHQRYRFIMMLCEKLKITIDEAAKLLDTDPKELTYLKFNYQMMEMIHEAADDVAREYIKKVTGKDISKTEGEYKCPNTKN